MKAWFVRSIALLAALLAATLGLATPALAADNDAVSLPSLAGRVTDACTGRSLVGATITISSSQYPPGPTLGSNFFGGFSLRGLGAGTWNLGVSAPGYLPLGSASTVPGPMLATLDGTPSGGIPVAIGSGNYLEVLDNLSLMPIHPPNPCLPPGPLLFPVSGLLLNACTGRAVTGASVSLSESSGSNVVQSNRFGLFAVPAVQIPPGPSNRVMSISAAGFAAIGGDSGSPGITILFPPGPPMFMSFLVLLHPPSPCIPPGSPQ